MSTRESRNTQCALNAADTVSLVVMERTPVGHSCGTERNQTIAHNTAQGNTDSNHRFRCASAPVDLASKSADASGIVVSTAGSEGKRRLPRKPDNLGVREKMNARCRSPPAARGRQEARNANCMGYATKKHLPAYGLFGLREGQPPESEDHTEGGASNISQYASQAPATRATEVPIKAHRSYQCLSNGASAVARAMPWGCGIPTSPTCHSAS